MKTKTILTMAIIAALPFAATAENISGAMYTAPATADTNHPAPTTQANAPYGRANIDTADQEHIATTAYVKGAYNSAIAGINSKQDTIFYFEPDTGIQRPIPTHVALSLDDVNDIEELISWGTLDEAITDINTTISNKRVEIYTTWDNDNAKTQVAFVNAPAAQ